jgi:thiol-disulfide isomerase/thioredoxin
MTDSASRRLKIGIIVAAVFAGVGVLAALAYDSLVVKPRQAETSFDIQRADVQAPEVLLQGPGGEPFSLSKYRGEVLFVNFWATWCPPCREEMPSMLQLQGELERAYPGRFRMIAVSGDEGWAEIHEYFQQHFGGMPRGLTVALDIDGKVAKSFYCAARGVCPEIKFPETYIVDRTGRLVAYVVNGRDWTDPAARRFLERLLGS